jgi:hypothetical protein
MEYNQRHVHSSTHTSNGRASWVSLLYNYHNQRLDPCVPPLSLALDFSVSRKNPVTQRVSPVTQALDGSQQWFLWDRLHRHETGTPNLVGPSMDRFADYDCSLPATSMFMLKPCVFSRLPCLSGVDDYSGLLRLACHLLLDADSKADLIVQPLTCLE